MSDVAVAASAWEHRATEEELPAPCRVSTDRTSGNAIMTRKAWTKGDQLMPPPGELEVPAASASHRGSTRA